MSSTMPRQGQCMCGSVRVFARQSDNEVGACHCHMCRQWGGGPFMETNCGTDVDYEGEEYISTFKSSDWAERGFCSRCGTHLFYRLRETGQTMVPVGLFETDENLAFTHQVFIDEKPSLYEFANQTCDMTGAEVFEKFGASA